MPRTAAFCTDCRHYVWLNAEGGCENGHARPALRDVRQVDSLPTGPVLRETRPIVGTDTIAFAQPGTSVASPRSARKAARAQAKAAKAEAARLKAEAKAAAKAEKAAARAAKAAAKPRRGLFGWKTSKASAAAPVSSVAAEAPADVPASVTPHPEPSTEVAPALSSQAATDW